MTILRTFIAIHLSNEARTALTALQQRLRTRLPANTVRWTAPQHIHLTLHFLGDVQQEDIDAISRILNHTVLTIAPFDLHLSGMGCFPTVQQPRVLWVGCKGDSETLLRLQAELGKQLQATIGFKLDSRPYRPHFTLGRVNRNVTAAKIKELGHLISNEQPKVGQLARFSVQAIYLMRSDLGPAGPEYTVLHRAAIEA